MILSTSVRVALHIANMFVCSVFINLIFLDVLFRGITEARFVYIFVLGILVTGIKDLLTSHFLNRDSKAKAVGLWEIYSGLVLLAALLFRPHNLVVLVFCLLIQLILTMFIWKILKFDAAEITIMHYWFGQAFFFFQVC